MFCTIIFTEKGVSSIVSTFGTMSPVIMNLSVREYQHNATIINPGKAHRCQTLQAFAGPGKVLVCETEIVRNHV